MCDEQIARLALAFVFAATQTASGVLGAFNGKKEMPGLIHAHTHSTPAWPTERYSFPSPLSF